MITGTQRIWRRKLLGRLKRIYDNRDTEDLAEKAAGKVETNL
jgi:hypothetical protein